MWRLIEKRRSNLNPVTDFQQPSVEFTWIAGNQSYKIFVWIDSIIVPKHKLISSCLRIYIAISVPTNVPQR